MEEIMFGVDGMEPVQVRVTEIPVGPAQVFGLLVDGNGEPVRAVAKAVGVVHAQIVLVSGVLQVRRADRVQVTLDEFRKGRPSVWVLDNATVKAYEPQLRASWVKALRCTHSHDNTMTGYANGHVWGTLKKNPATGRNCWYCENGACTGRTQTERNRTYRVTHTHNDAKTCGEASARWKMSPAKRAEAAEAAEKARVKEERRLAGLAKARATRAAKRAAAVVDAA